MIALLATVQKHDMPWIAMRAAITDLLGRFVGLFVAEVAGVGEVAAIDPDRPARVHGHAFVVVGLDAQDVDTREVLDEFRRHVAEVGCVADVAKAGRQAVADRALHIVLKACSGRADTCHRHDESIAERFDQAVVKQRLGATRIGEFVEVPMVQVHRRAVLDQRLDQRGLEVVAVEMGEQHRLDSRKADLRLSEFLGQPSWAEPRVKQQYLRPALRICQTYRRAVPT